MAWNDPMGEWIKPKAPDLFDQQPPLRFPAGRLRRVKSCPDTPAEMATAECELANQQGYFLWDDLFKTITDNVRDAMPQVTREIVPSIETTDQIAKFELQPPPRDLRRRSAGDVSRINNTTSKHPIDEHHHHDASRLNVLKQYSLEETADSGKAGYRKYNHNVTVIVTGS